MSRERESFAAEGFDFFCGCFQILRLAAGNDNFRSGLGESKRYGLTDAAAAAGNYRHFIF